MDVTKIFNEFCGFKNRHELLVLAAVITHYIWENSDLYTPRNLRPELIKQVRENPLRIEAFHSKFQELKNACSLNKDFQEETFLLWLVIEGSLYLSHHDYRTFLERIKERHIDLIDLETPILGSMGGNVFVDLIQQVSCFREPEEYHGML